MVVLKRARTVEWREEDLKHDELCSPASWLCMLKAGGEPKGRKRRKGGRAWPARVVYSEEASAIGW